MVGGGADVICKAKGLLAKWAYDSWQLGKQAVDEELGVQGGGEEGMGEQGGLKEGSGRGRVHMDMSERMGWNEMECERVTGSFLCRFGMDVTITAAPYVGSSSTKWHA